MVGFRKHILVIYPSFSASPKLSVDRLFYTNMVTVET